jgi:hypothetical protein
MLHHNIYSLQLTSPQKYEIHVESFKVLPLYQPTPYSMFRPDPGLPLPLPKRVDHLHLEPLPFATSITIYPATIFWFPTAFRTQEPNRNPASGRALGLP